MRWKSANIPRKQNDALLKGAFEDNFADFLQFLFPNADEKLDLSRGIEFWDKEMPIIVPDRKRKTGTRVADLLARVFLSKGEKKWILVHTEIEGGSHENFPFRMFQYDYRLRDRHRVPVETIAVFIGDKKQSRPSEYREEGIFTTHVHFKYHAYRILDHTEAELLGRKNIFAQIAQACRVPFWREKCPMKRSVGEGLR